MNGNKTARVPALIKRRVYKVQEGSLRPAKGAHQERSKKKTTCKTTAASHVRESLIQSLIHAFIGLFKNINLCYYGLGTVLEPEDTAMNKTKSLLSRDTHTNKSVTRRR